MSTTSLPPSLPSIIEGRSEIKFPLFLCLPSLEWIASHPGQFLNRESGENHPFPSTNMPPRSGVGLLDLVGIGKEQSGIIPENRQVGRWVHREGKTCAAKSRFGQRASILVPLCAPFIRSTISALFCQFSMACRRDAQFSNKSL